jgi:hypothetical protein
LEIAQPNYQFLASNPLLENALGIVDHCHDNRVVISRKNTWHTWGIRSRMVWVISQRIGEGWMFGQLIAAQTITRIVMLNEVKHLSGASMMIHRLHGDASHLFSMTSPGRWLTLKLIAMPHSASLFFCSLAPSFSGSQFSVLENLPPPNQHKRRPEKRMEALVEQFKLGFAEGGGGTIAGMKAGVERAHHLGG